MITAVRTETRVLPKVEYPRLAGTEAEAVWPMLPESAEVIVVERDLVIVACWILLPLYHVECLWIHPDHRKSMSVARRLWIGMRRLLTTKGIRNVLTAALTDDVRGLLQHVGAEQLPGDHYVMRVSGEE